jgi:hypothetical protein
MTIIFIHPQMKASRVHMARNVAVYCLLGEQGKVVPELTR